MQVIAIGKWSKTLKRWHKVLSLRRRLNDPPARRPPTRPGPPPSGAS